MTNNGWTKDDWEKLPPDIREDMEKSARAIFESIRDGAQKEREMSNAKFKKTVEKSRLSDVEKKRMIKDQEVRAEEYRRELDEVIKGRLRELGLEE